MDFKKFFKVTQSLSTQMHVSRFAAGAALGLIISGHAGAGVVQTPPEAALWIAPAPYNSGQLTGPAGQNGVPGPHWHIAQWNIPVNLSGTQTVPPGSDWKVANQHARVKYYDSQDRYELAQNGTKGLACNTEFNLFLESNQDGQANYPGYPDSFTTTAPLSQLTSIQHTLGVRVKYEAKRRLCRKNFVSYTTALVFTNPTSGQTLFYQLILRDSRKARGLKEWCPSLTGPSQYCVDEGVQAAYGQPALTAAGPRRFYSLNVLPRIKAIIQSGDYGIDTNLANWRLSGNYYGHILEGGVIPTSQWDSFSLTAQ